MTTRLIPEMKFGCNGTIVGYKVVASPNRNGTQHPKIQIWRQNTTHTGLYYKPHPDIPIVHPSPQLFPCDRSSFANGLLQCTLYESARVKVQCGDVLGLELPPLNDDRHEILFRSGGPKNFGYHGNLSTISALTESEADFTTNDTPLITFLVAIGNDIAWHAGIQNCTHMQCSIIHIMYVYMSIVCECIKAPTHTQSS